MGLYAALRKGDMPAIQAALPANDSLAGRLAAAAEQRQAAATRLASAVGLAGESFTLALLADRTPEPYRSGLRTTRSKLRELTAQVDQFRAANANLIDRLRSYFRDVLSPLTAVDTPVRYGPSGSVVAAAAPVSVVVSG